MAADEMKTFAEFWPYYVREHSRAETRAMHAAGTITSTTLAALFIAKRRWRWLPAALATGYAAAWVSHFFVEHNRPATFKHPLWSFAADYKMVAMMLAGRMGEEITHAHLKEAERGTRSIVPD